MIRIINIEWYGTMIVCCKININYFFRKSVTMPNIPNHNVQAVENKPSEKLGIAASTGSWWGEEFTANFRLREFGVFDRRATGLSIQSSSSMGSTTTVVMFPLRNIAIRSSAACQPSIN
jgi:hypothetical protein